MKKFYFKVELKPVTSDTNLKYAISSKPLAPGKKGKGEFIVITEENEESAIGCIDEIKKKIVFVLNDYLTVENPTVEKPKKCRESGCIGAVDLDKPIPLKTGCSSYTSAFACDKCGRLYWYDKKRVSGVKNRRGEKAFL